MDQKTALIKFRQWKKENPDWELICDIEDSDKYYIQWHELPKEERMRWIGKFKNRAKEAFEEFSIKDCKVIRKVLNENLELFNVSSWPKGQCMLVFKTDDL